MKKVHEDQRHPVRGALRPERHRHVPMMPRKMMLAGLLASLVVLALLIVPRYVVP